MKYLKTRKDSKAYFFQRKLPKELVSRAEALGKGPLVTLPLKLDVTATQTQIAIALDEANQRYERYVRLLRSDDVSAIAKADIEPTARALVEQAGYRQGSLHGVDDKDEWFETVEHVLGFYPDFTDTSKKPDNGQKECLCRSEESTVPSSKGALWSRRNSQASVVLR